MPVTTRQSKTKQTRINMSVEDYEALQKIASQKKTSISDVLMQAAKTQIAAERANRDKMLSIIGMGEGSDEAGSINHDEALYER